MSERERSEDQLHHFFPTAWVSFKIFCIIISTSGCGSGDTPMKVISHTGLSKGHLKSASVWMTLKSRWKDSRTDALDHRYFLHLFNCFLSFNLYHDDNIIISCCQIFLYCYSPSSVSEGTSKPPPTSRRKLGVCDYLSSLFGIGNL